MFCPLVKYRRQTPCKIIPQRLSFLREGVRGQTTNAQCKQSTPGSECASGLCSDCSHRSKYTHLAPKLWTSAPLRIAWYRSRVSLITVAFQISLRGAKRSQSQRARCCFKSGVSTSALSRGTICCSEVYASRELAYGADLSSHTGWPGEVER